jgi:4-diphosphocytidyl-2-C-methyl-D-erythritol kinase
MKKKSFAAAKLTLTLRMKDKRDDGFNNLEALTVFLGYLGDRLKFEKTTNTTSTLSIENKTKDNIQLDSADNLIIKALNLFHERLSTISPGMKRQNFDISLVKSIPVQAGLGGGSSDAATTLQFLNEFYGQPFTNTVLYQLAAELGSDVSACLYAQSCWMLGRGEAISPMPIDFGDLCAVVITPDVYCSTPEVFQRYEEMGRPVDEGVAPPPELTSVVASLHNDLGLAAFDLYPELVNFKQRCEEVCSLPFQVAGSGSTLFLLAFIDDAQYYAEILEERLTPRAVSVNPMF